MQFRLVLLVALLSMASPALADVLPPQPKPPPPNGPAKAVVRGVPMKQELRYWRGRRWMTVVDACPAGGLACAAAKAQGCLVTAVDGKELEHGRLDLIQAAAEAASGRPLTLSLDLCQDLTRLDLAP